MLSKYEVEHKEEKVLDPETLDEFLSKNKKSLDELRVFKEQLTRRE